MQCRLLCSDYEFQSWNQDLYMPILKGDVYVIWRRPVGPIWIQNPEDTANAAGQEII